MPHSYVSNLMHCIFSTKERFPFIDATLEPRFMALHRRHCSREQNASTCDWWNSRSSAHALVVTSYDGCRESVQLIKGGSSKWVHDTFREHRKFAWQDGYGAFSVSASQVDRTISYINSQKQHHRKRTFEEEFIEFLDKHGVAYDRRYLFK